MKVCTAEDKEIVEKIQQDFFCSLNFVHLQTQDAMAQNLIGITVLNVV